MISQNQSGTATAGPEQQQRPDPATATGLYAAWVRTTTIVLGIGVAAVPFVAQLVFVVRATPTQLAASTPDDAYYYFEIARRAAGGEGFTFDGINGTSGFHPLWQWMLTGLHLFVPGDTAFPRAAHVLALVLVAAAFAVTTRVIWRAAGPAPAIGGLVLASRSLTSLWDLTDGMETAVVVLGLALLLAALDRFFREPSTRRTLPSCAASPARFALARPTICGLVVPSLALRWWPRPGCRARPGPGCWLGSSCWAPLRRLAHRPDRVDPRRRAPRSSGRWTEQLGRRGSSVRLVLPRPPEQVLHPVCSMEVGRRAHRPSAHLEFPGDPEPGVVVDWPSSRSLSVGEMVGSGSRRDPATSSSEDDDDRLHREAGHAARQARRRPVQDQLARQRHPDPPNCCSRAGLRVEPWNPAWLCCGRPLTWAPTLSRCRDDSIVPTGRSTSPTVTTGFRAGGMWTAVRCLGSGPGPKRRLWVE